MSYTVTQETFDSVSSFWNDPDSALDWSSVFILPAWLKVWWQFFGAEDEMHLVAIREGEKIIGIAPLRLNEGKASFIGSADVCDYLDFIIAPGMEADFFNTLLGDLKQNGIRQLDLESLRPDSTVITNLVDIAQDRGYEVLCQPVDVTLEMDLPSGWEEYLAMLSKKQRHEVRRKLRRLWEAVNVEHECIGSDQEIEVHMDSFMRLFSLSQEEKAGFMTPGMELFFKSLAGAMADIGLLRFGIIKLDSQPVAMTMGFDYNNSHYLYNSSYNPEFNSLSVGLLCKVLCIKESIERGRKKWDFLKGGETYKYQLGGREIPLSRCKITIK